jgi:energy-coupling factor transport system permease protein
MRSGRVDTFDSFWRQRDPRIKLLVMFSLVLLTMLGKDLQGQAVVVLLCGLLYYSAKIPVFVPAKAVYSLRWLLGLILLTNLLFITEGRRLPGLVVTDVAFNFALVYAVRIINLILTGVWLMSVTDPLALIRGIEGILAPAKRFLPVGEVALVLGLALQFLPALVEEAQEITMAQRARGLAFHGGLLQKAKGAVSILTPLFLFTLRRSSELAQAMEARGFIPGEKRGSYEDLSWKREDTLVLAFLLFLLVGWTLWGRVWV